MRLSGFSRSALSCCAVAALLAGCGALQLPTGTSGAMASGLARHVRMASGSGACPALSGGTGILPDGDFSQAADPPTLGDDDKKGIVFAPDWEVSQRTIDFMGTTSWARLHPAHSPQRGGHRTRYPSCSLVMMALHPPSRR
jgi:hypothetical protein